MVHNCRAVRQVEGYVAHVQVVIGEVFFDQITLVAQANNEIAQSELGIDLHDMPKNRAAADLDQRLWPDFGFFGKPAAKTSGQYDHLADFHHCPRLTSCRIAVLPPGAQPRAWEALLLHGKSRRNAAEGHVPATPRTGGLLIESVAETRAWQT